jgi:hypothetical protein
MTQETFWSQEFMAYDQHRLIAILIPVGLARGSTHKIQLPTLQQQRAKPTFHFLLP